MKIHGTAKGGALNTKDFGVAFGGAAAPPPAEYRPIVWADDSQYNAVDATGAIVKVSNNGEWSQTAKSTRFGKPQNVTSFKAIATNDHHVVHGLSWYSGGYPNGWSGESDQNILSYGIYGASGSAGSLWVNGVSVTGNLGNDGDQWEIIMSSTDVKFYLEGDIEHTSNAANGQAPDTSKDYYGVCSCHATLTGLVSSSLKS